MTANFSASKDFNVNLKHIRREFEPEMKSAGDHMLASPWTELTCLSKDAQFALSEVMHLSHATHVQQEVIPTFIEEDNSVIVEAKTGSGKTLAFVIPLTERLRQQNFIFSSKYNTPFLSRNICAFIVSPSRVLAQQTFIVGRNFSCRYPFAVKFLLVDRHVEGLEKTASRLAKVARCGGFVAVGTVADIAALNELLVKQNEKENEDAAQNKNQENDDDDEDDSSSSDEDDVGSDFDDDPELKALMIERKKKMKEKKKQMMMTTKQDAAPSPRGGKKKGSAAAGKKQQKEQQQSNTPTPVDPFTQPKFSPLPGHKFVVIVDEADVVLKDQTSYNQLFKLCQSIRDQQQNGSKVEFDFGLYGATATSATQVQEFTTEFKSKFNSSSAKFQAFQLSALENDAADLRNVYEMAPPHHILQCFIHMLNMHHSKKHFVFFNSISVLNFVYRLLVSLSKGVRPVLRTSQIFALHEGMKDSVRFEQFGKFVRYNGLEQQEKRHQLNEQKGTGSKASWSETQKEKEAMVALGKKASGSSQHGHNHYYQHATGATASQLSVGAILLCTDEAAFGLDVRDVDYVIHFEPPTSLQSFIHRSGRVARMGMSGTSILLLPETEGARAFLKEVTDKLFASGEKTINRLNVTGAAAPIASNIAAFVQEIATDAEEAERQNLAAQTAAIVLPSRRSRLVEERLEIQAHKNALGFKPSLDNEGQAGATGNMNVGQKMVANAIKSLCKDSKIYDEAEATAVVYSRH